MVIEIFSDGSATTADKPGGYAWILIVDGQKHSEGSGHVDNATNNDMELQASIEGLKAAHNLIINSPPMYMPGLFKESYPVSAYVTLVSDSKLVLGWANGTYSFRQQDKIEKYKELQLFVKLMNIKTRHVLGHFGNEHNERCDKLANQARLSGGESTYVLAETGKEIKTLIGTKKDGILCFWYKNVLKVIDLSGNMVEDYDAELHGERNSNLELKDKI
jgi:ribonuclease HI